MKIFFHKKIVSFLLINLISFSLSDNEKVLKIMELNQKIKGKMDSNESREYYQLKLPKEIPYGSLLIFTVKESRKGIREGDELFSDPDIYISKSNKYPSNREDSDWYSERYGNDILSIPSYAVEKEEIFYICMYCQFKCRYELYSYLSKEVPAETGKYYSITLTKKSSLSYSLYVPNNPKQEELNVITINPTLKNFRVFMAKDSPSSQNTFQIIPSWEGGYVITVNKFNKQYCTDCTYHLLFQTEEEKIDISFHAYFQSTLTKLTSGSPINDVVKFNSKRCYYFDTSNIDNIYKSKLVISINLFSGSLILRLMGWKEKLEEKNDKIREETYSYHIDNDKIILLQKEDFQNFDKEVYLNEIEDGKKLYLCAIGEQMTSYIINIYFLSEAQELQRFNYISPGSEIIGYLQGGQLTRYTILDFNLNQNSVITLSFTSLEGKVEFFSTQCKEKCQFDDELLKERLEKGLVTISTDETFHKKKIIIKPEDNICYKENSKNQKFQCKILALVKCFGNSEDLCSFKIFPTINDQPIFMSPKKTYYNVITKGKIDLYEIVVDDEEVNSIVVVLTSVSGDAELDVEIGPNNDDKSAIQKKLSRNKNYIPDVVRITPGILKKQNVAGKYLVKVSAFTFSSYNLYYYTTRQKTKDEQPKLKDITLSLSEGNIIKDYFPNDISYKIFSYNPQNQEKEDIKIVLTRINVQFSFKVYLDFSKIKYHYDIQSKFQEALTDYDWASDFNNELTINKNDKKYSKKGPYYIVVTRDNTYQDDESEELEKTSLMSYYLGVTKRGIPFNLNEGVEHSETLSEKYDYQDYYYIHKDINNPLNLEVNILNGEVDVFIDVKELKRENITNIYKIFEAKDIGNNEKTLTSSLYMRFGINDFASIELFRGYFEQNCKKRERSEIEDKSCPLYIYVIQSKTSRKYNRDSQYIINSKSSINTATFLLSGQVYYAKSRENITDHYIIEEVKHKKGTSIYVKFKHGSGQIFVRIPKDPETGNNITFPDQNNFDYKGDEAYMGKIVQIPPKVFDRINSNSLKLQILISVLPYMESSDNKNVEYSITYGSEPKRISQNIPYQSFISPGEQHYFTFYFDEKTENIYISLSNMNGDADMYLNYGIDNLPTTNKYNWASTRLGHEYIDINVKDKYFKRNKKENISGYYTLLVIGYIETTYTLYISSHPDKIFPLTDNNPVSCQCQNKGEKCYFRYNNVYDKNIENKDVKKTEIIFTTQYIYGNGKMFASIYKDQELTNDPNKKYQQYFPTEDKFHFSNFETGKRNYLKVNVENQYYSEDALILLTYICEEKTDVEITAASLQHSVLYSYIDPNRENMFYLKYNESLSPQNQEESKLNFYVANEESLIYEFHAYTGKAKIRVFTNETVFNEKYEVVSFDYNHIAEFYISAENYNEYLNGKTYPENYFNSINNNLIAFKNLYFNIKPMSDFGFYVQIIYDRTWINIPIGESKTYLINKNLMSGYFDINNEYSNVEMSLSLEEYMQKRATIYVKVLVLSKDAKQISSSNEQNKLYHYEIPSKENYDYKKKTDDILGAINININNLPIIKDSEKDTKFIRALFTIEITKNKFWKKSNQVSEGPTISVMSRQPNEAQNPQTKVIIAVIPGINNFKRIDLPQHTYYFSNTSLIQNSYSQSNWMNNNEIKKYDGIKEVKIYSLDKRSNEDKKMIIQLHSCSGKFEFKLSKKIIDYDNNPNDVSVINDTNKYGANKFLVNDLKDKHLYLSIKSAQLPPECNSGIENSNNLEKCSKELSYLIYYYSLTDKEFSTKKQNLNLYFRYLKGKDGEFIIKVTPLGGSDRFNNFREQKDIEYNLFWTRNSTLMERLDNICYLSQIMNKNEENIFNDTKSDVINVIRNIQLTEKNEYLLGNLKSDENIYINILARNLKTNELIAYIPMKGMIKEKYSKPKKIVIIILLIALLSIVGYVSYNYYKEIMLKDSEDAGRTVGTELSSISSNKGGYQRINLSNK